MSNKVDATDMTQETKRERKPKLRFPEFRGAPGWEEKKLQFVCHMQAGKFVSASEISERYEEGYIRVMEATDYAATPRHLPIQGDILLLVAKELCAATSILPQGNFMQPNTRLLQHLKTILMWIGFFMSLTSST